MRYVLWVMRVVAYTLVIVVVGLFIDTIVVALSQQTDFLAFGWITRSLRESGNSAFIVMLSALLGLTGYGLYATYKVGLLLRDMHQNTATPDEENAPPPDHPYVDVLTGHRFQYMGKRTGELSGGGVMVLYDFRAQSGISWVTLTKQHPQGWFHASFTTVFEGHLLETQLYDRKSTPPHDDIEGKHIRRIMLRGNDLEHAYFRHTEAMDTLHIEHGKPLTIPTDYAEAIAWLESREKSIQRQISRTILIRYMAPVISYVLMAAFMIYTMLDGWLITAPELPEYVTFTIVNDEIGTDLWVYFGIMLLYFIIGTLAAPSYPIPKRLALVGYSGTALLALPVLLGLEDGSLIVVAILVGFVALAVGTGASVFRRVVRRIEWRRATVNSNEKSKVPSA